MKTLRRLHPMRRPRRHILTGTAILLTSVWAIGLAAENQSVGLSLLNPSSGRALALAEAYSTALDDVGAAPYNPGSLGSLSSGQAMFLYHKGVTSDSQGQLMLGKPMGAGALALQVGYYDAGSILLKDTVSERNVKAQSDLLVTIGYGARLRSTMLGMNVKYLSSKLLDRYSAKAYALDLGAIQAIGSRVRVGLALQHIGTDMKYLEKSESLPRLLRVGGSIAIVKGANPMTLSVEAPYRLNEQEVNPAVGFEAVLRPLVLRAGYRTDNDAQKFSMGAGFAFERFSLDYAFGLADELASRHLMSISARFGRLNGAERINSPANVPAPKPTLTVPESRTEDEPASQQISEKPTVTFPNAKPERKKRAGKRKRLK